jgi:hypothetical protein
MKASMLFVYGVGAALGLFALPANAAQGDGDWNFSLGGYMTAMSLDAKSTAFTPAGDQEISLDLSFSDLLDNLDYGASGGFVARKGPLSINVDLVFAGLSTSQSQAFPPPGGFTSTVDIEIDLREHELYVGYAAFEQYPDLEIIAGRSVSAIISEFSVGTCGVGSKQRPFLNRPSRGTG